MQRRTDWVFFVVSLLFFVLFLGLVVLRAGIYRAEAVESLSRDFDSLSRLVKTALDMGQTATSKVFREQMRDRYARSPRLLGLIVRDASERTEYAVPASSPYILSGRSPSGSGRVDGFRDDNRLSVMVKEASITLRDGSQRSIQAAYVVLPVQALTLPLRDSLLGILIILIAAIIALIVSYAQGDEIPAEAAGAPPIAAGPPYRESPIAAGLSAARSIDDEFDVPDFSMEEGHGGPLPGTPPDIFASDPAPQTLSAIDLSGATDLSPPEAFESSIPAMEDEARDGDTPSPAWGRPDPAAPQGLYSERSGLGWEAYLEERLDAELARSSTLEQDCSLVLLTMKDSDKATDSFRILARTIESFFAFRDLSFEYGPDGFAVALPGIGLPQALRMAEEFVKKITFALGGQRDPLDYLPLFIGISSRSGRLLRARLLIDEARQALAKAQAERDSRIVGFKADPDRYRDFLAGKV
jgi:GGDEF domain-containing protein